MYGIALYFKDTHGGGGVVGLDCGNMYGIALYCKDTHGGGGVVGLDCVNMYGIALYAESVSGQYTWINNRTTVCSCGHFL